MDKPRDVRRAKASRFSSANTHLNAHSGPEFKKMRRDKVRRLSFVDRLCDNTPDSEMPCVQSDDDQEDEDHPFASKSKRIKLPRKFFDDCQKVDHSSVPRKQRSAIRKRRRESLSPHFPEVRKVNHSANRIEPVKRDVMKKTKLKLRDEESEGSPGPASVMPISKDEEEVAEALYALAEMFPDSDKTETVKSTVPEGENDFNTTATTPAPETAQHSLNTLGSADETEKTLFSNQRTEFDMHRYKQYPTESPNYIPKLNCTKVPIFSKTSSANENRLSNSSFPSNSQLSREIGSKRPMHNINLANEKNKGIAVESVATFKGQNEVRLGTRENRNNGSAVWPGLSSSNVHSAKTLGSPVKLSAAKLPTWLGISTSTAKACSSRKVAKAEKKSQSLIDEKKLLKKCSTHVYISQLIKVLKVTEEKDSLPLQPTPLTADEGSMQGTILEDKKLPVIKNGPTGVVYTNNIACSGGENTPGKHRNVTLLHKRLHDDQHGSTNSGPYTTDNQSSNLFSALAGSSGHENGGQATQHRPGHRPDRSAQSNVAFLHPFTQICTTNPLSLPKNSHISTSFVDSADVGAAEKAYLSNSTSSTSSLTGLQKQQQHQQWLWAAPCKPEEFAAAASHIPNWTNSRQEFPHIMQYAQFIHPAALEVLGPRYIPVSAQQQQQPHLIPTTSLFPPRVPRYNHHQLSTSNMANGGVLHPDSRAAIPLLCKEHT